MIIRYIGKDASAAFDAIGHSDRAKALLATYAIDNDVTHSLPSSDELATSHELSISHSVDMRYLSLIAYSLVTCYALLFSFLFYASIFALFFAYVWSTLALWSWHKMAHTYPEQTKQAHMKHHKKPFLFLRWKYRDVHASPSSLKWWRVLLDEERMVKKASVIAAKKKADEEQREREKKEGVSNSAKSRWITADTEQDIWHFGPLYSLDLLGLVISYALFSSSLITLFFSAVLIRIHTLWSFYIHNAVHCDHHPWEHYSWFQTLRLLHIVHHHGTWQDNFSFGESFILDDLLGHTAWKVPPEPIQYPSFQSEPFLSSTISRVTSSPHPRHRVKSIEIQKPSLATSSPHPHQFRNAQMQMRQSHFQQLSAAFASPSLLH